MSSFTMLTMDDLMLWNPYEGENADIEMIADTATYIDTLTVKMVIKQYEFYNNHKSKISDEIMLLDKSTIYDNEPESRDELFLWITALNE